MKYRSARKELGYIASRLMLATGLAVVLPLATLTYPASAQQSTPRVQLGSSFDCARDTSQIVILICNNDQLRRIDLAQIQNYYTLRHVAPYQRDELRDKFVSAVRQIHSSCATEGTLRSDSQSCIVQQLTRLRQDWSSRISATGNRSAIEEASLDSAEILQAQEQLKSSGYIPPNAAIDGIFGTGTRAGLARLQTERGITSSGLLDVSTRRALQVLSELPASTQNQLPPCPTDRSVGWHMCFGTYTLPDGGRFVGEFLNNQRNGQGTFTFPNGGRFVGEYRNGQANGQGTFTSPNGGRFVGEYRNGQANGHGTFTSPDGGMYVGEYRNGDRSGMGTFTSPDGARYVGEWRENQRNGQGAFFSSDRRLVQNGVWRSGSFVEANTLPPPVLAAQGSPPRPPPQTPVPAAQRAPTPTPSQSSSPGTSVRFIREAGTFKVPVRINGVLELQFTVDSGASDVTIPSDVVSTLVRTGTISESDFIGEQTYILADGSRIRSRTFRLRQLQVGDRTITNVLGSVASVNGSLLLGQSFLSRFQRVSFDYGQGVLVLE